jgi:hypothetical protein
MASRKASRVPRVPGLLRPRLSRPPRLSVIASLDKPRLTHRFFHKNGFAFASQCNASSDLFFSFSANVAFRSPLKDGVRSSSQAPLPIQQSR